MNGKAGIRDSGLGIRGVHLAGLSAFAVAQPLYDLLGRNAEFFVAHRAGAAAIATLVVVVSLAVPLALVVLEAAAGAIAPRVRDGLHTLLVAALVALAALPVAERGLSLRPAPVLFVAIVAGAIASLAYRRFAGARSVVTVASLAALLFPLYFLFATPVTRLIVPRHVSTGGARFAPEGPVVFVVFDEWSTGALLDEAGNLDAERYPALAELARHAWWFPNALAARSHTTEALPAIVTGVLPIGGSLPIAADHPENIFTWLGPSYRLHVSESVTELCPAALCGGNGGTAVGRRLDVRTFASDLATLYLHIVTPDTLADRWLPSISSTWTGFGASGWDRAGATQTEMTDRFKRSMRAGRAEAFRQFVSEIKGGERPTLHFLHAPLPHHPYYYLRSGRVYSPGIVAEGLEPNGLWSSDPALVLTGYRQYLQQVEFTDRLVGELVAQLKATGLYDRTLLIITSDHGATFRPGEQHRTLTVTTYRGLTPVPTFVKLPGQQDGRISERHVLGIDILPTIAAVIGQPLPWQADGVSMLTDKPDRTEVRYPEIPAPMAVFDVRAEARRRERRERTRGALEGGVVGLTERLYPNVVGAKLADLHVGPDGAGMQVISDSFVSLRKVDPASGFVPLLVHGQIEGAGANLRWLDLAIAVNGTVHAITRTTEWNGIPRYFAILLPESAVQAGANTLEVLRLEKTAEGTRATPIPSTLAGRLRLVKVGSAEQLTPVSGAPIPVAPGVEGWVDRVEESPTSLRLYGWAADRKTVKPLQALLVFAGGRMVASGVPNGDRPDVAVALGLPDLVRTAFMIEVPIAARRAGPIRVFGVSVEGFAGEVQISTYAKPLLAPR